MPKKLVPNPEFETAPYELAFIDKDGVRRDANCAVRRAYEMPPQHFEDWKDLLIWFVMHEVPSHIEVEVPCP